MELRAHIILFIIIIIYSTASAVPAVQRNKHLRPAINSHKHDVKPTPTAPTVLTVNKPRKTPFSQYFCPPLC
ncbi:hypothetical protein F8M41_022585 [Gigaspora margarita]|uniref:Transmembrane protein n=1 Tax=Gigaspora margarita TaxID=4874 RepID=A0A8H4EI40_GIGMA|nr:hypothetical protein F8M41_022585 [Gigaspora margarita]